jgi:hypothetical protein
MLRRLASSVGIGLFAGAAGTAAMTLSSTIEMNVRGRKASDAPARAAAKVLGVSPTGEAEKKRFSNLVHWGYGTGWGAMRGIIGATGLQGLPAGALFFAVVWGNELVMLPSLGVAPNPKEWGQAELTIDAAHHIVYATMTSLVYETLES